MAGGDLTPEEARQRLSEIMDRDLPFTGKAKQALELGEAYLGVDNGHLTKIDPHTDDWEAVSSTDSEGPLSPGQVYDLRTTYCRHTLQQDTSVTLHDAPSQGWADDPAFETHGLACYHGTEITIDNETYGTVCFVSRSAREPFTAAETMFAELIARSLEHELQQRRQQNELTRQSNLTTVLNRVLRHNLRNSLAVIRGRAEQISRQFPATAETQPLIDQTDRLLELSEKARVLESVIVERFDRQETSIRSLLDRVIRDVATDFPDASITLEESNDVTLAVRPGLERALYELIENAAKHTGADPTVTVSMEAVPNAVWIQIDDNGPGLAKTEQQVLTAGAETPLEHGSGLGLWLAYWIVTSHDGTIEATVTDDGTCMSIELPRNKTTTTQDAYERDEPTLGRVQDKFRAVFDEASDAILIADDDGRYIDANERAADLFELPKTSLLGRSIREFVPGDLDFEETWSEFQATDRNRGTLRIVGADGTERLVEYSAKPNVVPGQHLSILRDVTAHRERTDELSRLDTALETVLSNVPVVFWTTDEAGIFTRSQGGALAKLGLEAGEVVGDSLFDVFDDHPEIKTQARQALDGEAVRATNAVGDRVFETWLQPVRGEDGELVGTAGLAYDVTDRERRSEGLEV